MTNNKQQTPHGFCETPEQKCTMNYCDENGCQNRKRTLAEPTEMPNNKQQTAVQLIIQALDIECKSRGMNVNWDMYLEMEKKQRIKDKLELSASWAKSREQTRETAMHIGFAKGFMSGLKCCEDYYEELNRTQLDEDEFTRNYIVDEFEKAYRDNK